jgi:O-antigen/teichoic acid export membrane protein
VNPRGVVSVGVATVLSALCGYAILYLAARDLAPAGFSVFSVFWGAFGLFTGAANGLLQEATREVRVARQAGPRATDAGPHLQPLRVAALVAVAAGLLIAGTAPLWAGHVFVESTPLSVTLLSVGLAGFCLHATLLGVLAGADGWTQYGSSWAGVSTATSGPPSPARCRGSWCCWPRASPGPRPPSTRRGHLGPS